MSYFSSSVAIVGFSGFCSGFKGYELSDLEKIERLYRVKIEGQLKDFLMELGKSDGGAIGDSVIQLYRPSWRVRQHLLFQVDFFSQMQDEGFFDYLKKPFVFAWLSETQYYFVQTTSEDINAVYNFDSSSLFVKRTEWDLVGFIGHLFSQRDTVITIAAQSDILLI
ncbi:hypothetical protein [Pseudomonas asplenii]|uniref:hypothetical protein n=1 Tax=Pseudomonas asplenii TaxID=53407 RepID=UPI000496EED7|nr:hypothetical protein [Pseudomonas fuscovaginae]